MYFEKLSASECGAVSGGYRLLPRDTYILSTADLVAGNVEPPDPRAATAASLRLPETKDGRKTSKKARKKCVQC